MFQSPDPDPPHRQRRLPPLAWLLGGFLLFAFTSGALYSIPPVRARLDNALTWRMLAFQAAIRDLVNPPDEFLPTPNTEQAAEVAGTIVAPSFEDSSPTEPVAATSTPVPTVTAHVEPSATPVPTEAPLPDQIKLSGIVHEYQRLNNCGPATLSMVLSFWGVEGDQFDTASFLKPEQADYNVRPDEMADYVNNIHSASLGAIRRVGGTVDLLQTLLAAGYPVIIEETFTLEEQGWMGHYLALDGYDLETKVFYIEDSYHGPDRTINMGQLNENWEAFNRTFIVVYPIEDEEAVFNLLGEYADLSQSYAIALETANREAADNPEDAFAFFNLGTNHNFFGNFDEAAAAFDQARNIGLPWRMLWYQSGPYRAYYNVGRYNEVIGLANITLGNMSGANHEESLFWRGWANYATGNRLGAIDDFQRALYFNHNFTDAQEALSIVAGS